MTPRQAARAIYNATHPVDWALRGSCLYSPCLLLDGIPHTVVIHDGMILMVQVFGRHGGQFKHLLGWPRQLIRLHKAKATAREVTRLRLLLHGLKQLNRDENLPR